MGPHRNVISPVRTDAVSFVATDTFTVASPVAAIGSTDSQPPAVGSTSARHPSEQRTDTFDVPGAHSKKSQSGDITSVFSVCTTVNISFSPSVLETSTVPVLVPSEFLATESRNVLSSWFWSATAIHPDLLSTVQGELDLTSSENVKAALFVVQE